MKHISILVPAGEAILSSIVGPFKIFSGVNSFLKMRNNSGNDLFTIDLVGLNKQTSLYDGAFQINTNKTIAQVEKTDLIIVTTIFGDLEREVKNNADFIPWIKKQHVENNAEVASLCVGAFLLAETGLLNGKSCTTHWMVEDLFREKYPEIELLSQNIIVEDSGIYSSGGAYSFLNLILHLVEKHAGREAAIWASKVFEVDFNRSNQSQFAMFMGQKQHHDESIKKAQDFIEENVAEKVNVEALAEMQSISRRNFVRRFKKATSNTPLEYIQRVKVEAAKKSLESTSKQVNEVMYSVGYNDDKAFRNTFKKFTGLSPIEYRSKYNRQLAVN